MRSMSMPRRNHQTESSERLKRAFGLAKGTPLSERMASGRPRSRKRRSKAVMARSSRVDWRASPSSRYEAVAMQNGVDGALGWHAYIAGQAGHQELADLPG